MIIKDILIVGAGPVGLFMGFECGKSKLSFSTIDSSHILGGQCSQLYPEKPIYDIAGYESITGQDLINNLIKQAKIFNPDYHLNETIHSINKSNDSFHVKTNKNDFSVKYIVLATGMGQFTPIIPNIETDDKENIHFFVQKKNIFQDLTVTVFGGGDSAVDWAIELSSIAKKVRLVHRREKFRAIPAKLDKLHDNVEVITNEQISSFLNKEVQLKGQKFHSDKLLFCFGMKPELTNLSTLGVNITAGKINVQNNYETNIENIYAIGDIANYKYKVPYISVGFAEAAMLSFYFKKKLSNTNIFQHSTSTFKEFIK